jgi:hypothetical protein
MRKILPLRVPRLMFGAGVAAALAFGAGSALAAPAKDVGEQFFCGFHINLESCEQCCGMYQATWAGIECYCGPETKW